MVDLIAIQINGSDLVADNFAKIERQVSNSRPMTDEPALVVLPECAFMFGCSGKLQLPHAEVLGEGPIQIFLTALAKRFNVFVVAGTMPIRSPESSRYYATSIVIAPSGEIVSHYHKIHLFDVEVNDGTGSYLESKYTYPGKYLRRFNSPWGDVGQSVCYDLRFAQMFTAMSPINVLVVPSAFTKVTGTAHWHALLKARSIELQCYVVAANQVGEHADGRETFGHSCIYSPWGELLSLVDTNEGFASAVFNGETLKDIRRKMPVLSHTQERYEFE
jgi:predicted amidohydrolase